MPFPATMPGKLYNATSKSENDNTQSRSYKSPSNKSSSYKNNSGGEDEENEDDLIVNLNLGEDDEDWPYE